MLMVGDLVSGDNKLNEAGQGEIVQQILFKKHPDWLVNGSYQLGALKNVIRTLNLFKSNSTQKKLLIKIIYGKLWRVYLNLWKKFQKDLILLRLILLTILGIIYVITASWGNMIK